jgi:hypothetical protein
LIALGSLLGALSTLSIIVILYVLAKLSERFGTVIKMRPRYRYYYIGLSLVFICWIAQLLVIVVNLMPTSTQIWLNSAWFLLLAFYLPIAIGVTIGLAITWRYWSWLVAEHNG